MCNCGEKESPSVNSSLAHTYCGLAGEPRCEKGSAIRIPGRLTYDVMLHENRYYGIFIYIDLFLLNFSGYHSVLVSYFSILNNQLVPLEEYQFPHKGSCQLNFAQETGAKIPKMMAKPRALYS